MRCYLGATPSPSLQQTKPFVTHRACARPAPSSFAAEANVRVTILSLDQRTFLALVIAVILSTTVFAAEIPVEPDSTAVLPAFLTAVVTGAPADSLVLRVSLYSSPGDGRFDPWAYIVVEELLWPFPPPEVRINFGHQVDPQETEPSDPQVVLAVSKMTGSFLNQVRRETVMLQPTPGMRAGELLGHLVQPFEFVEWVNPQKFIVTDGRGVFEISWVGRGHFELVAVEGVR